MKSATVIFSSFVLAGLLLVTVESRRHHHHHHDHHRRIHRANPTTPEVTTEATVEVTTEATVATKCGSNMTARECTPCNQICNSEPMFCILSCVDTASLCGCNSGYLLPTRNANYCVLASDCPAA